MIHDNMNGQYKMYACSAILDSFVCRIIMYAWTRLLLETAFIVCTPFLKRTVNSLFEHRMMKLLLVVAFKCKDMESEGSSKVVKMPCLRLISCLTLESDCNVDDLLTLIFKTKSQGFLWDVIRDPESKLEPRAMFSLELELERSSKFSHAPGILLFF